MIEPPGRAPEVEDLRVAFGAADTGWLDVTCVAGGQRFGFAISSVFDPFKDLARWLEALLDRGTPRLVIDIEGDEIEWHTFEAGNGRVRFVIAVAPDEGLDAEIKLDAALPRQDLIRAVYEPLRQFWHDNVAPGDWLDGTAPRDPTKLNRDRGLDCLYDFRPFRSARIEAALASPDRQPWASS